MARKKTINASDIVNWYMDFVLTHSEQPKSVYAFAKDNNFEEAQFYKHYGSFEALEQSIFKLFFNNTIKALENSEDYHNFDTRNKLLSFYYTFFEVLIANRSYVTQVLDGKKNDLKSLKTLSQLKLSFTTYVTHLGIKTIDFKQEHLQKIQNKGLQESAWIQLLITLKFWLDDTSASFEKTDIFIEKSIKVSFDVIDTTPLKSIIDFGKFLFKEKMQMS